MSPRRTGRATPVASGSTDTLHLGWLVPSPSPGWWPGFPGAEPCLNHVRHTLCVSDDYGKNDSPMTPAYLRSAAAARGVDDAAAYHVPEDRPGPSAEEHTECPLKKLPNPTRSS